MKSSSSLALTLLFVGTVGLVVLGIVMLSSASAAGISLGGADESRVVRRQIGWLVLGVFACGALSALDYRKLRVFVWPAFGVSLVLLALCLRGSPIADDANGSWRWIKIGFVRFQPSEFAKVFTIALLAHWYASREQCSAKAFRGFLVPLALMGLPAALIFKEMDLGATVLLCVSCVALMFIAGAGLRFLVPLLVVCAIGGIYFAVTSGTRLDRLLAFMDLEAHKTGAGWQQWQGLIAMGSGGVDGLGLGQGRQKMAYIPEAHNDFIFAVVGEELGLKMTLAVVFTYLLIVCCGTIVAVNAPDRFGMLLGSGLVILLGLQALTNLGVVSVLLPNKGIPLPFMSYGGSNLLVSLSIIGMLIGIHRQGMLERRAASTAVLSVKVRDRNRRDRGGL